jgi:hypothetical protein
MPYTVERVMQVVLCNTVECEDDVRKANDSGTEVVSRSLVADLGFARAALVMPRATAEGLGGGVLAAFTAPEFDGGGRKPLRSSMWMLATVKV